ncbi:MAG: hypothetical protein ACRCZH_04655, partial [Cetobacterium sp.]
IDYVFTRDCPPIDARLTPLFFSDHAMLSCTLSLPQGVTTGRGLWKLNCSLLCDKDIVREYKEQYSQWQTLQDFYESRAQWWEMVKGRTKTFFRQVGKNKKDMERRQMVGLQKRLQRYFKLLNQGFDFSDEIKQVKREMSDLAERQSKSIIFRCKETATEEGEKCSRYFFKKVVSRGNVMTGLKSEEGILIKETKAMKEMTEKFYGELYAEKKIEDDVVREVLSFIEKKIKDSAPLNVNFSLLEMEKGLKQFKRRKSPGADGLPVEFYVTFWDILANDLLTVFNEFDNFTRLPDSFRTGIATLLHKKDDKTELKNWRPITLLNLDCKLFSKILAVRMTPFLKDLIHPDQACAIPGRKITDSLVLIRDAICYAR